MQKLEEQIKSLPLELQKEVLEFVEFLLSKYSLPKIDENHRQKSVGGSLQKYANLKKIKKEKSAWAESAVDK
ncbi:MAG: DUF2281 domain-containing protein [Leptospiraceae bacterium]|nr:DUF2281 domain-containing protein [Leptospiraceae bacterium]MCP5511173.1 DUF2281 domain-containing protein [Leptospiraceae bacterium]